MQQFALCKVVQRKNPTCLVLQLAIIAIKPSLSRILCKSADHVKSGALKFPLKEIKGEYKYQ